MTARLPELGDLVGPYRIESVLGRGGMGAVYRARHTETGVVHALKVIRTDLVDDDAEFAFERFRREVEVLARIDAHPGIVRVHTGEVDAGLPWCAMDLVSGRALDEELVGGPLPSKRAARIVADAARAVAHAHRKGVIHRDLKPQNVMIDAGDGSARVVDFGLAHDVFASKRLTLTGEVLGTPAYMAPEQILPPSEGGGPNAVTALTDVYGLGAILYHLLAGRPPFTGDDQSIMIDVISTDASSPSSSRGEPVPTDLETVCLRALAKNPAARYPSAAALADDLERWLRGEPVLARKVGLLERTRRRLPRRRVLAAVGLLVVALAIATVAWAISRDPLPSTTTSRPEVVVVESSGYILRRTLGRHAFRHRAAINVVAFPPGDRNRLITAGGDDAIRIWDIVTAEPLLEIDGGASKLVAVTLADGGRQAILGFEDGSLRPWSPGSEPGAVVRAHDTPVTALTISSDGRRVLSGSHDRTIILWAADGDRLERVWRRDEAHAGEITGLSISPDGATFLSAGRDREVLLWSLADTAPEAPIARGPEHAAPLLDIVHVAADPPEAASASENLDLRGWSLTDAAACDPSDALRRIPTRPSFGFDVALTGDGRRVLANEYVPGGGPVVRLRDRATGDPVATFRGEGDFLHAFDVTPDGRHVVAASESAAYVWEVPARGADPQAPTPIARTRTLSRFFSALVTLDDGRLLTGRRDGTLELWDGANGDRLARSGAHTRRIGAVATSGDLAVSADDGGTVRLWTIGRADLREEWASPIGLDDGAILEVGVLGGVFAIAAGRIHVLDLQTGAPTHSEQLVSRRGRPVRVTAATIRADPPTLAAVIRQGLLWRVDPGSLEIDARHAHPWDPPEPPPGSPPPPRPPPSPAVRAIAIAANGTIVTGRNDGEMFVFPDGPGEEPARSFTAHPGKPVLSVAVTRDGSRAASAGPDGIARVFDVESGEEIRKSYGHGLSVGALAISPDGAHALSASGDGALILWSLTGADARPLRVVGHAGIVPGLAISPSSDRAVSVSFDQKLKYWNLERRTFIDQVDLGAPLNRVAFVDERHVVVAELSGQVRLIDLEAMQRAEKGRKVGAAATVVGLHQNHVYAVAMTPDDRVLSGGRDQTLRIWALDGRPNERREGHTDQIGHVAALDDARVVSTSRDRTVVWDLERATSKIVYRGRPHGFAVLPPDRIVIGRQDGVVVVIRADDGRVVDEIDLTPFGDAPTTIATHGESIYIGTERGVIHRLDPR